MMWVVLGHLYLFGNYLYLKNPYKFENVSNNMHNIYDGIRHIKSYVINLQLLFGGADFGYEVLLNALPSVDTFFFMSGLLVAYLSFIEMEKKRFNLALFYIHRYIRYLQSRHILLQML